MRWICVVFVLVVVFGVLFVVVQELDFKKVVVEFVGNFVEIMCVYFYFVLNLFFEVQSVDFGDLFEEVMGVFFFGIYSGWQVVEQVVIVMIEIEEFFLWLCFCENGCVVLVDCEDY